MLRPLALLAATPIVVAGCSFQDDRTPVGAYRTSQGFDARASTYAEEQLRGLSGRIAFLITQNELSPTLSAIHESLEPPDPAERDLPGIEGNYVRIVTLEEPSSRKFQAELIVYSVASFSDGLSFAVGRGTPKWGQACGTATIDATGGPAAAKSIVTITDCSAGTPDRPAPRTDG